RRAGSISFKGRGRRAHLPPRAPVDGVEDVRQNSLRQGISQGILEKKAFTTEGTEDTERRRRAPPHPRSRASSGKPAFSRGAGRRPAEATVKFAAAGNCAGKSGKSGSR